MDGNDVVSWSVVKQLWSSRIVQCIILCHTVMWWWTWVCVLQVIYKSSKGVDVVEYNGS